MNPREAAQRVVRQLQGYWRMIICMPLVYLACCYAIQEYIFIPQEKSGLYPLSYSAEAWTLGVFLALALAGSVLLLLLRRWYDIRLDRAAQDTVGFCRLLFRRLLFLSAICDTISFFGVIFFLLEGDLRVVLAFGVYSLLLYLLTYPSDKLAQIASTAEGGNGSGPAAAP